MRSLRGNPWAVLVALCAGFFMTLLDTTVVGVAIPNIVAKLGVSYSEVLWVSNAYVLVLAVLLIPGGKLGDLLGKRNMYLAGVLVFAAASLACALSQNAAELIAARAVQGVGAALLIPQTMSIIVSVFPADRRGAALGVWGAVAGVATIAGPPLGGLLVSALDWRWIFTVNVPLGVLVLIAAPLIIPGGPPAPRLGRFDVRGTVLVTAGVFCLVFGLQEGQQYDWGKVWSFVSIPLLLVLGVVLLVAFTVSQRAPGGRTPIVPSIHAAGRSELHADERLRDHAVGRHHEHGDRLPALRSVGAGLFAAGGGDGQRADVGDVRGARSLRGPAQRPTRRQVAGRSRAGGVRGRAGRVHGDRRCACHGMDAATQHGGHRYRARLHLRAADDSGHA